MVGFNSTSYTASEGQGTLVLVVEVFSFVHGSIPVDFKLNLRRQADGTEICKF